jgi:hypothetical protein
VVPLIDTVQATIKRVPVPCQLAIHSVASDLGANDPVVRQTLHARGILTLGLPKTVEPITPHPTPQAILDYLNTAGLNRKRTPYQVQLACAGGYSRPVVESHIASVLARGAGQIRYKGPRGAVVQLGMTVMAGLDHRVGHFQSPDYPTARRGGLRGAGGSSTDAKIAANMQRGFCPKNRSAAVVPSGRVRKKLCTAVRHARFLGWSRPRS